MSRWLRFLLAVILGLILCLFFGWFLKPVEIVDISPSMLSPGFRSELVLMVAEIYSTSLDLDTAINVLSALFSSPSLSLESTISYGLENGYTQTDLSYLQALAEAVSSRLPGVSP